MEEGTWALQGWKSPKQDLTSAKNQTIELSEGREVPYNRFD